LVLSDDAREIGDVMQTWYFEKDCDLKDFEASIVAGKAVALPPNKHAALDQDIPIYDCADLSEQIGTESYRSELMQEWSNILHTGAGVVVLKGCFEDTALVDQVSDAFGAIMQLEKDTGTTVGDHFGAAGANARIWNALEKLCRYDPDLFVRYYSNVTIALICETWLGPNYQMTSQTNLVRPGSAGQTGHRDYHLGFQTPEEASYYPATAHQTSPFLTLQGAVAHCDMPVETGPTRYLPYSQLYPAGYIGCNLPEFKSYFEENFIQLPLEKGDAVFFNPAVMHGAGENRTTNVDRLANLLQISSAMGRSIESVNRLAMCEAVYPALLAKWQSREMSEENVVATVAACAEGYPFPTNLDLDPPVGGLVPKSQADIMLEAVERGLKQESFLREIHAHAARRVP